MEKLSCVCNIQLFSAITVFTGASCEEITENMVRFVDKDGAEQYFPCDHVVISAGMRSRAQEAEAFRDATPEFRDIGDCTVEKNVRIVTETAFDAVNSLID